MSAAAPGIRHVSADPRAASGESARVALLGTGTVGRAVLARLEALQRSPLSNRLSLVHVANSRVAASDRTGLGPTATASLLGVGDAASGASSTACASAGAAVASQPAARSTAAAPALVRRSTLDQLEAVLDGAATCIVIDATASEDVATRHARWLHQGVHVVTACKLGQGGPLARWQAIRDARVAAGTLYGDSATVGAGLPVLRALRELQAGGDRIHAIAGVLSGSLAWLFGQFDGLRPFSGFVREARAAGYTEPDPRDDLSGEDVRRKILILARAAGVPLDVDDVAVESLVPDELAHVPVADLDASLALLDTPLRTRFARAYRNGEKLRFIARLDTRTGRPRATVGLESLPADDPLAIGAGTDNRIAIWSDRYAEQPLVIQGPGAGAGVTAAALLDDALRIAQGNRVAG
ncbi:homoserine dehydrogenase [Lysobacter korlensis]|uniref:Homoserine dehydrogenase n=1 Tax=Lysobacter korlensis TaxID=553636 RepID=A0ABV6S108_9GAMM